MSGDALRRLPPVETRTAISGSNPDPSNRHQRFECRLVGTQTVFLFEILAGAPAQNGQGMGSFEDYTRFVRDALMWLGLPDIATSTDRASSAEAAKPELLAVLKAWHALAESEPIDGVTHTAADLVAAAGATAADGTAEHPGLQVALATACPQGLTTQVLGYWLRQHKGIWAAGLSFDDAGKDRTGTTRWRLQTAAAEAFEAAPLLKLTPRDLRPWPNRLHIPSRPCIHFATTTGSTHPRFSSLLLLRAYACSLDAIAAQTNRATRHHRSCLRP
jgi:hypothetical protein